MSSFGSRPPKIVAQQRTTRVHSRSAFFMALLLFFAPVHSMAVDTVQIVVGAFSLGVGIYGITTVNPNDPAFTESEMETRRNLLIGSWILAGGGAIMIILGALKPEDETATLAVPVEVADFGTARRRVGESQLTSLCPYGISTCGRLSTSLPRETEVSPLLIGMPSYVAFAEHRIVLGTGDKLLTAIE